MSYPLFSADNSVGALEKPLIQRRTVVYGISYTRSCSQRYLLFRQFGATRHRSDLVMGGGTVSASVEKALFFPLLQSD